MKTLNFVKLLVVIASFSIASCSKSSNDEEVINEPEVFSNLSATNITSSSALFTAKINSTANIASKGFVWSTTPSPTVNSFNATATSSDNPFTHITKTLKPNTKYYLKAYCLVPPGNVIYSNEISFTTPQAAPPAASSFFAKVDTADFNPTSGLTTTAMTLIGITNVTISARKTPTETIGVVIDNSVVSGKSYTINQFGQVKVTHTKSQSDYYVAQSGTMNITTNDVNNKRIIGTFDCVLENPTTHKTVSITDGKFDVSYN